MGVQSGIIGLLIQGSAVGLFVLAPALIRVTDAAALAEPESAQVVAQLWKLDASKPSNLKMIESRYLVNLSTMSVTLDKHPTSDDGLEAGKRQQSNDVYIQLLKRFRESGIASQDDALGVAIREIEKAKGAGVQPSSQMLVGPDGTHAVLSPQYGAYALVDLGTLSAASLTDRRRGFEAVPIAWSPDSQFLAFPTSDNKGVVVYDVKRRVIQSTVHIDLKEPCALAWSPNMRKMVILDLVSRRLHVSPVGLLEALSGHPDFRNDLVLRVTSLTGNENRSVVLTSNLTEQSFYEYGIQWK